MVYKYDMGTVTDYTSKKSRTLVTSGLVANTFFCLADSCDPEIVIQQNLKQMIKKTLNIQFLTVNETLFNNWKCVSYGKGSYDRCE